MALWRPDNLAVQGAKAAFHQAMDTIPTVWQNHVQTIQSTSSSETYTFPGFLPTPREFLNSRQFQGARDFTYTVENNEYELSMNIERKAWEDDQHGLIKARITEMAEVWATFKDSLFTTLLANSNVSGNNSFDGTTFIADDHSAGTTGQTNDNNLTSSAPSATTITAAELLPLIASVRSSFWSFTDDQGRPFNVGPAMSNMRAIIHPAQERAFTEAMGSNFVGTSGGETPLIAPSWITGWDVLPYIATGDLDEIWFTLVGATRKPFIYQERTPLEVIVLDGANDVAENNGVLVLTRQRFVLTYGDHRRAIMMTVS